RAEDLPGAEDLQQVGRVAELGERGRRLLGAAEEEDAADHEARGTEDRRDPIGDRPQLLSLRGIHGRRIHFLRARRAAGEFGVGLLPAGVAARAEAGRTSAVTAARSSDSPSWRSIARVRFASRPALKRRLGSASDAPSKKLTFTWSLKAPIARTFPPRVQT